MTSAPGSIAEKSSLAVEVSEREHDRVDNQRRRRTIQMDRLAAVTVVADVDGLGRMDDHFDLGWERGEKVAMKPLEVGGLHASGRKRGAGQGQDLVAQR